VKEEKVFTAYIGDTDIYEWTMGVGKSILMPIMLETCKDILSNDLTEKQAARVEAQIRGKMKAFDFWIKLDGIDETLSKIMDWALEDEQYEICSEVKKLQDKLVTF